MPQVEVGTNHKVTWVFGELRGQVDQEGHKATTFSWGLGAPLLY